MLRYSLVMKQFINSLIFIFSFAVLPTQLSAQNIYISNDEKLSSELIGFDVVGRMSDGNLVIYKKYRYKDELELYDSQMNIRRKKEITIKAIEYESLEVLKMGNQIFHFYTQKQNKQIFLFAQVYNETAEKKGDPILIDSTSRRIGDNFSGYKVVRSRNGDYAMAYQYEFSSGKTSKLLCAVVNNAGKIVTVNTLDMPTSNFTADVEKVMVSNKGMPIALIRNDAFSCKKDKAEYAFLLACGSARGSFVTTPINADDCLREVQFDIDNNTNNIILAGFTGEQYRNAMAGYTFMQIDPYSGDIITSYVANFSLELLNGISSKADKSDRYVPVYKLTQVIPRADGGALLVAEYFEKTTENYDFTNYDPYYGYRTSTRQVDYYEYNDVFLLSVSPEGIVDWSNIIRKRQVSKDDRGANSSFLLANCIERLFFIYNEDISQNSNVMQYEMLADGTLNRKSLFNPSNQEVELRPQAGKQVGFNEIIIPSIYKRSLSFISIVF